jgi:predicted metalloprotease with PDZ domain
MQKILQLLFVISLLQTNPSFAQTSDKSENRSNATAFMGVTLGTSWGDGVEIQSVSKGYGAERAGLENGDIVTAINDDKIKNSSDFTKTLKKYQPADVVDVTVDRNKEKKIFKVKLAESPNSSWKTIVIPKTDINIDMEDVREDIEEMKRDLKEDLEDLKDDIKIGRSTEKARLGIYPSTNWNEKAVCVTGFTKNSAAKNAGLKENDLILKIDNDEVNTEEELRYTLEKRQPNEEVTLTIRRDKKEQTIKVKLGSEKVMEWDNNVKFRNNDGWGSSYSKKEKNNETRSWSSYTFADGTQVDLNDFKISPSTDAVTISFEAKLNQPFSVVIYDDNGKEVAREEQSKLEGKFEKKFTLPTPINDSYFTKLWINGKEAFSQKISISK